MNQRLVQLTLLVKDYDEAIAFYTQKLGFELKENKAMSETKRWVVVSPKGEGACDLLLAKAATAEQLSAVGNQTGGRVFLFLYTDDLQRDYQQYSASGVHFVRLPAKETYGMVAVFQDLYGNLWDLIEPV